jgi:hypothetical protein
MPNQFTIHYLVCSTPPGLEEARDLFLTTLGDYCGRVTMPDAVLLAPASFRDGFDVSLMQGPVKSNIKNSAFFLGIFGQDPTDPAYKRLVEYAIECAENPDFPMRRVTLLFQDAGDVAPEVLALRERMTGVCEVRSFAKAKDLPAIFEEILAVWYALLRPGPAGAGATPGAT